MPSRGRPARTVLYERLAYEVRELREKMGGLPRRAEAEGIWKDIWYHEAHNSTAIEGNTLVLREVESLLSRGQAVGNKQLKDYLEVRGYADAAEWVYGQAVEPSARAGDETLTLTEVRHVHRLAMSPVWEVAPHEHALADEAPGNLRRHNIQPFPSGMRPPEWTDVPSLMTDWIAEVNAVRTDSRPVAETLADRHAAFERVHPFLDGNGRTGRLVLNLVLVRLGYPPAVIQKRERPRYLDALHRADEGDPGPLAEILARAILDNLLRFIIPSVAGPVRLVPLESLASVELSAQALSQAASRGRLRAIRDDRGHFRSTQIWVNEYLASRYASLRALRGPRRARTGATS